MEFAISTTLDRSFDETVDRVREAFAEQGFGILTEIDVTATMKAKLDEDVEPYVILGACNPELAFRALEADRRVGLLLPCNVVVRDAGDGRTAVDALDPGVIAEVPDGVDLGDVGQEARSRIEKAMAALD